MKLLFLFSLLLTSSFAVCQEYGVSKSEILMADHELGEGIVLKQTYIGEWTGLSYHLEVRTATYERTTSKQITKGLHLFLAGAYCAMDRSEIKPLLDFLNRLQVDVGKLGSRYYFKSKGFFELQVMPESNVTQKPTGTYRIDCKCFQKENITTNVQASQINDLYKLIKNADQSLPK